ncbi:unnamed protein product, partial [marine sediment metagenome]
GILDRDKRIHRDGIDIPLRKSCIVEGSAR